MLTPVDMFLYIIAAGLALLVVAFLFVIMVLTLENAKSFMGSLKAALDRYAVRNEIVIEHYDQDSMQHIRKYKNPTPRRVRLAKKAYLDA